MKIHKDGHSNQAGGCCCPDCGNTCGFHPEWQKSVSIEIVVLLPEPEIGELELADTTLDKLIQKSKKIV